MENLTLFEATTISIVNSEVGEEEDSSRVPLKLALAVSYLVLFIIGTVGNGTVILMIINVLSSMKKTAHIGKRNVSSNTSHVFIYVLGLSIVDLLVILHLPFLVADLLKGQWVFGIMMCKLYWFGESVNKLLSSFLMTVLSWDRYMAVCRPVRSMKIRSNATAVKVLIACTSLAVILLIPVLSEATVFKIDKIQMIPLVDGSVELENSDRAGTTMRKCMFDADATFTLYTFAAGFALPAFLIIIFYAQVIFALHKSSRQMRTTRGNIKTDHISSNRVKKVTKRIIAVILFYFFCWTPQWTLNIMSQFNLIRVSWMTPALSAMFFVAHLLVCFNSAANPVLYAYINRELRTQHVMAMHRKRHSVIEQQTRLMKKASTQSRPSDVSASIIDKVAMRRRKGQIMLRLIDVMDSVFRSKQLTSASAATASTKDFSQVERLSSGTDESRENEDEFL